LAGLVKYGRSDFRDVLERASARETAARTAVGALCKQLLSHFGIEIAGHVLQIGAVESKAPRPAAVPDIRRLADESDVRCIDPEASAKMVEAIAAAKQSRDTLGGIFEVCASGVPVGLGSYAQWDRKLDGRLAQAFCSIPAVKGVEIGPGFQNASLPGSKVHDEIFPASEEEKRAGMAVRRGSNRAGGLEGGVSNGEWIVVRAAKKPISSLLRPLQSIDFFSKEPKPSHYERSDICAVPPAAVIGEAMMAIILADAMLEKFGGDSLAEMVRNWRTYQDYVASL
jgi:chorismate synthase